MADSIAAKLVPNCKELRTAYLSSLKVYSKNPQEFETQIFKVLKSNSVDKPAYRAILLATLFDDRKLLPALKARAKVEQNKKLRYPYAVAALERIKSGHCSLDFSGTNFDEICRLSSPVAKRMVDLSAAESRARR